VQVKEVCGHVVESRFARLHPVQAHILGLLGLPQPAAQVQGVRLNHVLFVRKATPAML